jgi:hypothetical protein
MADHTDNALRAAIKALDEVVAPAVDASNPLAREQLRLVSRYIAFLRERNHYQADRERFELRHYWALARSLRPHALGCPIPGAGAFDRAIDAAETLLDNADARAADLRVAIDSLTTAISMLARSSAAFDADSRREVEAAIVDASKSLFDVQRAFYLPMGFEPVPDLVPPLAQALAARA